jgi:replicative superfamily II helicase
VANTIREMAIEHGELDLFRPNENEDDYDNRNVVSRAIVKQMQDHASRSTNRELKVLLPDGLAIHHAGMVRSDRSVVERMFKEGLWRLSEFFFSEG